MTNLEEQIEDYILEEGLSSKARTLIKENIPHLSSEFLTDILAENVNLYISYLLLIEYLPYVWKEDKDGNTLNVPLEMDNHAMDAIRYGIYTHCKARIGAVGIPEVGVGDVWA